MDNAEIQRRVIGLLTLAYNTNWDPDHGLESEPVERAIGSLLDGWGGYSINFDIPAEYAGSVRSAIEGSLDGLKQDVTGMIANFVWIFTALAHEVKESYPGADIDGFLRKIGLDAADE